MDSMIAARPDLLIVGGLTIDRFADGSTAAGGSVLHAARATVAAGRRVATITAAGPEPEAAAAVEELASMGPSLVHDVPGSIRYEIQELAGRRRLTLEAPAADLRVTEADVAAFQAVRVLLAPVAGELSVESVVAARRMPLVVGALQGWLRSLEPGKMVRPLPLASLAPELDEALDHLDALVASEEDLAAVGADPVAQLVTLRRQVGDRPLLVVTTGADGAWVDDGSGRHHLPAPHFVKGISTVGAGDVLAALLSLELGAGLGGLAAATSAVATTTKLLAGMTA